MITVLQKPITAQIGVMTAPQRKAAGDPTASAALANLLKKSRMIRNLLS